MFQRKPRRFRRRINGRKHISHGSSQNRMRPNHFTNGHSRNNYKSSLSAEKSLEKYTSLAKEAMSSGDKTLYENYLQHADHYMRIIEDKNRNKNNINQNTSDQSNQENKNPSEENNIIKKEDIKNKV